MGLQAPSACSESPMTHGRLSVFSGSGFVKMSLNPETSNRNFRNPEAWKPLLWCLLGFVSAWNGPLTISWPSGATLSKDPVGIWRQGVSSIFSSLLSMSLVVFVCESVRLLSERGMVGRVGMWEGGQDSGVVVPRFEW